MKLLSNTSGDMNMILAAVIMSIVFAIGIIIVFNVHSAVSSDLTTLDGDLATARGLTANTDSYNSSQTATNSSEDLMTNLETFFTVGPIAIIVVAAVGILGYVMLLRRK